MQPRQKINNNVNNVSMTKCHKGGIKIRDTGNNNTPDPFAGVDPFAEPEHNHVNIAHNKSSYETLDLNIENYSREELFKLFGVSNISLTESVMKECKKLVLKSHPDKSRLNEKYFIFFSKAYNKLKGIYEFQNKIQIKKTVDTNEYFDSDNATILSNVFEQKKDLKDPKNFNSWFNEQFDKHKLEDPNETGYGGWLKSDEDIIYTQNVTKSNMASEMEKIKKTVQTLTTYNGVNDTYASTFSCSLLMAHDSNFSSGSLFSNDGMGYTDLRQAYVESVIPVTEDDYNKTKKYKNVEEYKRHRDNSKFIVTFLSKEEAIRKLFNENKQKDEESVALAFYYAQQSEKAKAIQENFWSGLKQVTNW